jgi:hypothetical protein
VKRIDLQFVKDALREIVPDLDEVDSAVNCSGCHICTPLRPRYARTNSLHGIASGI